MTSSPTERVGRYQLLEPIGHGPSGVVSRAKVYGVAGFERQFAIKQFHSELATGKQAQALSSVARAYGGLEHPRIARMSEFGVARGTTFTAVEYVAGLDAMRLITELRLAGAMIPAGGALALVSQAARAVGYAHGRGIAHLGLSPTNVVITPDGDVKITDFGILSATLPARPVDVPRLAQRVGYLAPEQLANEATSAATDVFALGVLAYEMVTGQRAFGGGTPAQIAQAVLGKPPSEPALPRPIVRVLLRCLARSPFERFPDARAFADALDAALRVAPVPGTRKDIGAQVQQIVERLADLHSGELSGMLSFNVGNAPGPAAKIAALGADASDSPRDSQGELSTAEFVRSSTPPARPPSTPAIPPSPTTSKRMAAAIPKLPTSVPSIPIPSLTKPSAPVSPTSAGDDNDSTLRDLPRVPPHTMTMTGLAPPPIQIPPSIPKIPGASKTSTANMPTIPRPVVGAVPPPKPGAPPARPLSVELEPPDRPSESPVSPLKMPPPRLPEPPRLDADKRVFGALRPDTDRPGAARTDLVIETDPGDEDVLSAPGVEPSSDSDLPESLSVEMQVVDPELVDSLMQPAPATDTDRPTSSMAPSLVEQLARESRPSEPAWKPMTLDELAAMPEPAPGISQPGELPEPPTEIPELPPPPAVPRTAPATPAPGALIDSAISAVIPEPPERSTLSGFSSSSPAIRSPSMSRPEVPIAPAVLPRLDAIPPPVEIDPPPPRGNRVRWVIASVLGVMALAAGAYVAYDIFGGGSETTTGTVATTTPADAAVVATANNKLPDIGEHPRPHPGSGRAEAPVDAKPAPLGDLKVTSTPPGARVYIDGADSGTTPLTLPGTPDTHTIGVFLAGHELYTGRIDGHGKVAIDLPEVTPTGGWAGIKVVRCRHKERYYVFVDGKPTGMTCPTERIHTVKGHHTVEVYDLVTETRQKWEINIKQQKFSHRVRIGG